MTLEELKNVQKSCESAFLSRPGVHGVGIGYKTKNGQSTNQIGIIIFVDKKLPADSIPAKDVIPSEVSGVPTDVVEKSRFVTIQVECSGSPDSTQRPLVGGCQIGVSYFPNMFGTVGGFGYMNNINNPPLLRWVVGVSCEHVLGPFVPNPNMSTVYQPANGGVVGKVNLSQLNQYVDAAGFALQNEGPNGWTNCILGIGAVAGTYMLGLGDIGRTVSKSGVTSGLTNGSIRYINVSLQRQDGILAIDQIFIDGAFCDHGDSGSFVILQDPNQGNLVVGLLWGKSPDNSGPQAGAANNIQNVTNALNIVIPPPPGVG